MRGAWALTSSLVAVVLVTAAHVPSALAASTASTVSTGDQDACAFLNDGTADCWGAGGDGQLGNGNLRDSQVPVAVKGLSGVTSIATGSDSACAVADGGAACWGDNSSDQLGDDSGDPSSVPVAVQGLGSGVRSISVGGAFACAVLTSGAAECWGDDSSGELGDGGGEQQSGVPVQVSGLASGVQSISAAGLEACAVLSSGGVDCWGSGNDGTLGNGTSSSQSDTPVPVSNLSDATAVAVADDHVCALTSAGAVSCWGENYDGQLGDGDAESSSDVPVANPTLTSGVSAISSYAGGSCAIQSSTTDCWGIDSDGEVGNGTTTASEDTPQAVSGLDDAQSLGAGSDADGTCAVESGGAIACWGDNDSGQFGDGATTSSSTPVLTTLNENVAVSLTGSGSGTVISAPAGIDCGAGADSCSAVFPTGSKVELIAAPASGVSFVGFSGGGCGGDGILCSVTANQAVTVAATFDPAPTIQVTAPTDGSYTAGSALTSSFTCQPAQGVTVTSCLGSLDGGAAEPSGSALSTIDGTHTFEIDAVDSDGAAATTEVTYIAGSGSGTSGGSPSLPPLPTVTIGMPQNGQTFTRDEYAPTSFSCADSAGPGIVACTDSSGYAAPSGALDTSTLGSHQYTVTAQSGDGESGTGQITYTVVAPPATPATASAGPAHTEGDTAIFELGCEGTSGTCTVTAKLTGLITTKVKRHGQRVDLKRTVTYATKRVSLAAGSSRQVSISLDRAEAKRLAARHRLSVLLTIASGMGKRRTTRTQSLSFASRGRT